MTKYSGQGRPAPEWWWAAAVESVAVTIRNAVEDCMMTRGVQRVAVEAVDELLHAARCGRLPRWRARQARTLLRLIEAEPRFAANRRSEARGALRALEEAAHDALTEAASNDAPAGSDDAPAGSDDAATAAASNDAPAGSDDNATAAASNDAPAGSGNAVTAAGSSGATPAATSAAATKIPAVVHRGWTLTVEWGGENMRVAVATG
ncbi:hypothetical protein ONE63_003537 [Megalurothrips usitatus]|uniref:Uncharacterized protein n=1 Tax=Megalurothrips usitatus TaxID=439358 RepID=A0AAV7X7J0_9NEOP|nr:hypothetical protein ONE63_003537 [Megalurothrips usitatus]